MKKRKKIESISKKIYRKKQQVKKITRHKIKKKKNAINQKNSPTENKNKKKIKCEKQKKRLFMKPRITLVVIRKDTYLHALRRPSLSVQPYTFLELVVC